MCTSLVTLVGQALSLDERALAARLGVSVFSIRRWQRREPPHYIVLALAALVTDVDATEVREKLVRSRTQRPRKLGLPPKATAH